VVGSAVDDVLVLVDGDVVGATVVVVASVVVVLVDDVVDDVLSALLCSSEHAPAVNASAPTVRQARTRREVMAPVCQPEPRLNVQFSG
jgi:hypothetical protein